MIKSLPTTSGYLSSTSLSSVAGEVCNKNDREDIYLIQRKESDGE